MGYSNGTGTQDTPQAFLNQAVTGAKTKWVEHKNKTVLQQLINKIMENQMEKVPKMVHM